MENHNNFLVAKTALLETICIAILLDRARTEKDPVSWVDGLKRRFRRQIDEKTSLLPEGSVKEAATLTALEVFNSFFDSLERGVRRM
jgi:hypothetical protein